MKFIKKLYRTIEIHHILFIILAYFLVNFLFYHDFWHELIFDNAKIGARYGEVYVAEWAMDKVYQNIVSRQNPFAHSDSILYPFGLDFTSTDSGNGFYFVFLRPFLSEHQSLAVIVATGFFFANLGMYTLLRKMKISRLVSFCVSLAFGYMTFLMTRIGHLNYMSTYIFPWFYFLGYSFITTQHKKVKLMTSLGLAFFFVLSLYLNLYYFIMLCVSIGFLILYAIISSRKHFFSLCKKNTLYFLFMLFCIGIFLLPWLQVLYETYLFEGLPKTIGWGGAIEFSSDLFGFFIPGIYSYFLHPLAIFFASHFKFASGIFENFTYPGLIILFSYFILLIFKVTNKLPSKTYSLIKPYLFISIGFWILTLGPFLHVFGKWGIMVDDGIRIVIPLPFILFHYLPFMTNIRVPGRLIVAFIFFSYIICGYLFDYFLNGKTKRFKTIFFVSLLLIFFLDHYYIITYPPPHFIPFSLYKTIKKDPQHVTVFEIPSVVRDGFTYFGNSDGLGFIEGQIIHNKPILAGYLGRIPSFKINYYQRNPFLGYMGRLMDDNIEKNGGIDKNDLMKWKIIDYEKSIDSINFLDVKYTILDENRSFASSISATLAQLGFKKTLTDNTYSLWQRDPEKKEYLSVDIGSPTDDMFLGVGWNTRENGFRWAWKNASVMFKVIKPRKFILSFQASAFHKEQKVKIYVNKKEVTKIILPTHLEEFSIPIDQELNEGINVIHFIFSSAYRPSEVIPNNKDNRQLSAKFTEISLK